jgi:hypothetical protein
MANNPRYRAEEIYHRLALNEKLSTIDARWMSGVEDYLRGAEADFPASAQGTYLASRLGIDLPPELAERAGAAEWERQAATRARDLLVVSDPSKALAVIRERPRSKWTDASPLYLLESQALARISPSNLEAAVQVARDGIAAVGNHPRVALDLLLQLADLEARRDRRWQSREYLHSAIALAQKLNDPIRLLAALADYLRDGRILGVAPEEDAATRNRLAELLTGLPDSAMSSNATVVRRAAAELVADWPGQVARVVKLVGLGPLDESARRKFGDAVRQAADAVRGSRPPWLATTQTSTAGGTILKGEPGEPRELGHLAEQLLVGDGPLPTELVEWFRSVTVSALAVG